jgi:hypothetical protein
MDDYGELPLEPAYTGGLPPSALQYEQQPSMSFSQCRFMNTKILVLSMAGRIFNMRKAMRDIIR